MQNKIKTLLFIIIFSSLNSYAIEFQIINWKVLIDTRDNTENNLQSINELNKYQDINNFKYPHDLNRGEYVITYVSKFKLPSNLDIKDAIIHATPSDYPYNIYLNGICILKWGFINTNHTSSNYKGNYQIIPYQILDTTDSLTIIMQTFPKGNSVPPPKLSICNRITGTSKYFWQSAFNYSFISGLSFTAFFIFIIYLVLWFGSHRKKMAYIYFSLASLCISVGYWNVVFSSPSSYDLPLWSIARAMFGLTPTFLILLITNITKLEKKMRIINTAILISGLTFSTAILIQKDKFAVENIFHIYTSFHVFPTLILSMIIFAISIKKEKILKQGIVLIGFVITFIAAMHDFYFYKTFSLPYFWTIAYGYSFLELSILVVLASDLYELFESNKRKTISLKEKNKILKEQSNEIKSLSMARDNFLNNMAHELRTPLQGILGSTELLNLESQSSTTKFINDQFHSYLRNLNNIIDLSTSEMTSKNLTFSPFSPITTIRDLVNIASTFYTEFESKIDLNISSEIPNLIKGDKERFSRIIENILFVGINTYTSGTLYLTITYIDEIITLNFKCKEGLFFSAELYTNRVTENNVNDHNEIKNINDLSLRAIFKICNALNGKITINESNINLSIPFAPIELKSSNVLTGNQILLVEDNKTNQKVIKKLLENAGFEILIAEDGVEAIEQTLKNSPDLILMDIQLPLMNGFEATRNIRTNAKIKKDLPIIAITAHANMQECLDSGMNDYLSKPVHSVDLLNKISTYIKTPND